ncbi:hypothetical protein BT69DRAFT_1401007 [Atractiella rhizophila]|nr:hypothetical protein BT69DRAFT_1401007 [Atractiella rhizophila]
MTRLQIDAEHSSSQDTNQMPSFRQRCARTTSPMQLALLLNVLCGRQQEQPPLILTSSLLSSSTTLTVAMGNNNPAALAIDESKRIWGKRSQAACLVSLGSGLAQAVSLGHKMAQIEQAVKAIVEDCSRVAKMMMQEQRLGHRYHHFSDHMVGSIKREEWERTQVVEGRTKGVYGRHGS